MNNPITSMPHNQGQMLSLIIDTAVRIQARGGDPKIVECFDSAPAMLLSALGENIELLTELLSRGVDPDVTDRYGRTALHVAVGLGNFDMVQLLVAHGADANHVTAAGDSPLSVAIVLGYPYIAAYLRRKGNNARLLSNTDIS